MSDEAQRVRCGAPPRDGTEVWSEWRATADDVVLEAIDLYATYLIGQTSGMSDALSLPAVVAMCEVEAIPQEERPDLTQRLLLVNNAAMAHWAKVRKAAKHG